MTFLIVLLVSWFHLKNFLIFFLRLCSQFLVYFHHQQVYTTFIIGVNLPYWFKLLSPTWWVLNPVEVKLDFPNWGTSNSRIKIVNSPFKNLNRIRALFPGSARFGLIELETFQNIRYCVHKLEHTHIYRHTNMSTTYTTIESPWNCRHANIHTRIQIWKKKHYYILTSRYTRFQ